MYAYPQTPTSTGVARTAGDTFDVVNIENVHFGRFFTVFLIKKIEKNFFLKKQKKPFSLLAKRNMYSNF